MKNLMEYSFASEKQLERLAEMIIAAHRETSPEAKVLAAMIRLNSNGRWETRPGSVKNILTWAGLHAKRRIIEYPANQFTSREATKEEVLNRVPRKKYWTAIKKLLHYGVIAPVPGHKHSAHKKYMLPPGVSQIVKGKLKLIITFDIQGKDVPIYAMSPEEQQTY